MTRGDGLRRVRAADCRWTLVSPVYDLAVALVGWHRWQDDLVSDVTQGRVLEVGCGPAHLARALLTRGVDYVGLDRNRAMVGRAAGTVAGRGPGRASILRADLRALPFRDECFDVVVATGVLALLTVRDRTAALAEMTRVSRGEVRLLEPMDRPQTSAWTFWSRLVALVRERPLAQEELVRAGLEPEVRGRAVLAGVYSRIRAVKPPRDA